MEVLIRKFGLLVCFLIFTTGFSITSNTKPLHESGLMTEDKYECLVKLFMGEHTARLKLKQQVNQRQSQQHQKLTHHYSEETVGANEEIDTRFTKLEKKYNSLLQKQESLFYDLQTIVNQSKKHQDKHTRLEEKLAMLEEKNDKLEANVFALENVLSSFALNTSHELELIMDKQQELETELINTSAAKTLQNVITKMNTEQELSQQKINTSLSQLNTRLDKVYQNLNGTNEILQSSTKKVSLTACMDISPSWHVYNSGEILRFLNIRSIIGINNSTPMKSGGMFVCEDAGLYLITARLAAMSSNHANYQILKNNSEVVSVLDEYSKGVHTSTGIAAVEVKQNDTISVKLLQSVKLYRNYSCLTIVKIA